MAEEEIQLGKFWESALTPLGSLTPKDPLDPASVLKDVDPVLWETKAREREAEKVADELKKVGSFAAQITYKAMIARGMSEANAKAEAARVEGVFQQIPGGMIGRWIATVFCQIFGLTSLIGVVTELAGQDTNSRTLHKIVDVPSLLVASWRDGNPRLFADNAKLWGFGESQQKIIQTASQPYADLSMLPTMSSLLEMDYPQFSKILQSMGYDPGYKYAKDWNIGQVLWETHRSQVGAGELLELRRRGKLDDKQWHYRMSLLGHRKDTEDMYLDLQPRLPDELQLLNWYRREHIDKDAFIIRLQELGYTEETAKFEEATSWLPPTPTDVIRMAVREVFTPEIAEAFGQFKDYPHDLTEWGKKVGLSEEVLKMYWAAHWDLPSPGQGFDMYHRGLLTHDELTKLMRALDIMPFYQEKMLGISHRLIPRRTIPKLVKQEVVDEKQVFDMFFALGYSPENSKILAKSAFIDAATDERTLTKAEAIDAYVRGWIQRRELQTYLEELDYGPREVRYYLASADVKRQRHNTTVDLPEIEADNSQARELTKGDILAAYIGGLIDRPAALAFLDAIGYATETGNFLLQRSDLQIATSDLSAVAKQYRRLFDAGLLPESIAASTLIEHGFTQPQAQRIVRAWSLERGVDLQLAVVRDKLPTRTDATDWLKKGVIDVDAWVAYMGQFGYPDETVLNFYLEALVDMEK